MVGFTSLSINHYTRSTRSELLRVFSLSKRRTAKISSSVTRRWNTKLLEIRKSQDLAMAFGGTASKAEKKM